jgi:hypothetical protein
MDAALKMRRDVQDIVAGDLRGFYVHPAPPPGTDMRALALSIMDECIEQSADNLAATHSPALAQAFYGVATGTATPLLHHVDHWLKEGGRKGPLGERTKSQYRSFVNQLAEWCRHAGIPPTVEAITKAVAGRFVTEEFVANDVNLTL